ncbi:MAG: nicotinamide mononucleotide transporter [Opitutaceae bacterium]|nr:nicotinamide mononucleotide transporter [Opitutaceae bacterium]MBP9912819.1 nicotinamide mononucleotide transporter [Opitutaceae bacterium]
MNEIFHSIWAGITGASWMEQLATVLGLLGVWLTIRQSLWNFPVGLVQVTLSGLVFYEARLYADMKLQVFFFAVLAYGWWHWARGGENHQALRVTRLTPAGTWGCVTAALAGAALWGWYLRTHTDALMPYRDAFIASFSILAQWLQARKKLENWIGWMLVNAAAVVVYWMAGLHWFAVLYVLFFVLAVGGHYEWLKSWKEPARD